MTKLKGLIIERFGSVNNFFEKTQLNVSRTNTYAIINGENTNITVSTLKEIAQALGMSYAETVGLLEEENQDGRPGL